VNLAKNNAFSFSEHTWNSDDYVSFSPDSRHLLSFSRNENSILIWSLISGKLVQSLVGHKKGYENHITHAVFLPSCLQIVSLSKGGELFVWDLKDGSYKDIALISEEIIQVSVSSDGASVYLFNARYDFQLVNLREKKDIRYFTITTTPLYALVKVDILFDGTLFICAKNDQSVCKIYERLPNSKFEESSLFNVKVWAGQFGNQMWVGNSISVSRYGNYVAEALYSIGGEDRQVQWGEINIWNPDSKTIVRSLKVDDESHGATRLSSNGRYFSDGVTVWNTFSGEKVFSSESNFGHCLGFLPNERYVFVFPQNIYLACAFLVDLEDNKRKASIIGGHGYCEVKIAGNCALSIAMHYFFVWDLESGSVRHCLNLNTAGMNPGVVFLSRDGKFAITQDKKERIDELSSYLWDLISGDLVFESKDFQGDDIVLTPDCKYLLSRLLLLDIDNNKIVREFEGHEEYSDPICLSSNGYLVLSGSCDGSIILWSLLTGGEIFRFKSLQQSSFSFFEISPKNKYFISLGKEKGIHVWSLETKNLFHVLDVDKNVFCASFFMGDEYIISCGEDNKVKFWHVQTGQLVYEVEQEEKILSLSVSLDGKKIYLGSQSGISTWDFQN
jgi:WD40 repeat protein